MLRFACTFTCGCTAENEHCAPRPVSKTYFVKGKQCPQDANSRVTRSRYERVNTCHAVHENCLSTIGVNDGALSFFIRAYSLVHAPRLSPPLSSIRLPIIVFSLVTNKRKFHLFSTGHNLPEPHIDIRANGSSACQLTICNSNTLIR